MCKPDCMNRSGGTWVISAVRSLLRGIFTTSSLRTRGVVVAGGKELAEERQVESVTRLYANVAPDCRCTQPTVHIQFCGVRTSSHLRARRVR